MDEFATRATYFDKLVQALRSREPQTAKRSAWILGELGNSQAVDPLLKILQGTSDIYFMAEILTALGKLDGPDVIDVLRYHARHGAMPVRFAAIRALEGLLSWESTQSGNSLNTKGDNDGV